MAPKQSSSRKQRLPTAKNGISNPRQRRSVSTPKVRTIPKFSKYCDEIERDRDGNPTHDTRTGFRLTARGTAANEERLRIWTKCHPPFIKLPPQYIPNKNSPPGFPLLLWGIPFTHKQALDYAARHNIGKVSDELLPLFVLNDLFRYIGMEFEYAYPLSLNHDYLFVLYDNRSLYTTYLSEEREARIVKIVQRELKTNFEPMWWWDEPRNEIRQNAPCQMDLLPDYVYKEKDF
ncbi:hypothetical protein C8Q75DRAFT_892277 [Abortiporus biennis]|nr:hypothetical protein C8Q75DRAFT_892277 [Abortiporus biennis]